MRRALSLARAAYRFLAAEEPGYEDGGEDHGTASDFLDNHGEWVMVIIAVSSDYLGSRQSMNA